MRCSVVAAFAFPALVTIANAASIPSSSNSTMASCDLSYDYKVVNATLQTALLEQIGVTSQQAQMASESSHLLGYPAYGNQIASMVGPVVHHLNNFWTPALNSVVIKCARCADAKGKTMYSHPFEHPIMAPQYIYTLFNVTRQLMEQLDLNQCSVEGYQPASNVHTAMRPFLDAVWSNMGVGAEIGNKNQLGSIIPAGAIMPFYDCISSYATPAAATKYLNTLLAVNQLAYKLNGTGCVAH